MECKVKANICYKSDVSLEEKKNISRILDFDSIIAKDFFLF